MACKGSCVLWPNTFGSIPSMHKSIFWGVFLTSNWILFCPNHMSWSCYLPWNTKNRILRPVPERQIYVHYNPCSALFRKVLLSMYVCVSWPPSKDEVIFFYTCLPLECALDTSVECALKKLTKSKHHLKVQWTCTLSYYWNQVWHIHL